MNNSKNTEKAGYGNNKQLPLVTVITPAYNRASYLDETILSILNQDYPNLEYIVLDDGSADNTLKVIKKYQDRLRWDTHKNMGETNTVNKGFAMAKGEIIGVVNSDDPLLPGAIRKIVEYMMSDPKLIVVYPDWNMIDSDGKLIQQIKANDFTDPIDMVKKHHCLPGPGAFFRCEVIEKLKGRDPEFRYVSDLDFWFRAGVFGKFARIPEVLATFRVHLDSATVKNRSIAMAEEHIRLIDKYYSHPNLLDKQLLVKSEAYSSALYVAGCVCDNKSFFAKAKYFIRAIFHAPMKYLGEYRLRLLMMFLSLIGLSQIRAQILHMRFKKYFPGI